MGKEIRELLNGTRFLISDSDCDEVLRDIWDYKIYDSCNVIRENFSIIDIGAHIGIFTVYAAKKSKKGMVYAYEPHPENFKLLKENIEINKIKNAKIFNYAVLENKGYSKLFLGKKSACHSMYLKGGNFVLVKTTSLKDIFNKNKINFCDLLKIDTEGAECEILSTTQKKYFEKIGIIILEYHNALYRKSLRKLVELLNKLGFKIFKVIVDPIYDKGVLYAKNTFLGSKSQVLGNNMLEYYKSRIRTLYSYISQSHKIMKRIDPNTGKCIGFLGLLGFFLKNHFPKLYFQLKIIKVKFKK